MQHGTRPRGMQQRCRRGASDPARRVSPSSGGREKVPVPARMSYLRPAEQISLHRWRGIPSLTEPGIHVRPDQRTLTGDFSGPAPPGTGRKEKVRGARRAASNSPSGMPRRRLEGYPYAGPHRCPASHGRVLREEREPAADHARSRKRAVRGPGRQAARSRPRSTRLAPAPPAYPPGLPSERTTRWHGTTTGSGFFAQAVPTARTARGLPAASATSA